jgi:hypothetical protein
MKLDEILQEGNDGMSSKAEKIYSGRLENKKLFGFHFASFLGVKRDEWGKTAEYEVELESEKQTIETNVRLKYRETRHSPAEYEGTDENTDVWWYGTLEYFYDDGDVWEFNGVLYITSLDIESDKQKFDSESLKELASTMKNWAQENAQDIYDNKTFWDHDY